MVEATGMTGLFRDSAHNYFLEATLPPPNDDCLITIPNPDHPLPLISVTNAIKSVNKADPLMAWAKREVASCAVRNLELLVKMIAESGPDAAQKWLISLPDYKRDTAAASGTRIHSLAEAMFLNRPFVVEPDMEEPVAQLRAYNDLFTPRVLWVEKMVVNLTHGYAGTLDLLAYLPTGLDGDWELWLLDIKSGQKEVYKENGLQLAGLNAAEYAGSPGNPQLEPMVKAQRFGIILLKPHFRLVEVFPDNEYGTTAQKLDLATGAFLHARYLQGWLVNDAPHSVGTTVKPPKESK